MRRGTAMQPFATRGRGMVAAILAMFALLSASTVALSIRATERSRNRAAIVQVAARQRTLAERYVQEVLLARAGALARRVQTRRCLPDGRGPGGIEGDRSCVQRAWLREGVLRT